MNPPFWVCPKAGGILIKINKPQLKANTPADFALERVLFIVLRIFQPRRLATTCMDSFSRVIDANDCTYGRLEGKKIGLPRAGKFNW